MEDTEQEPLIVDLFISAITEKIETHHMPNMSKWRLSCGNLFCTDRFTYDCFDRPLYFPPISFLTGESNLLDTFQNLTSTKVKETGFSIPTLRLSSREREEVTLTGATYSQRYNCRVQAEIKARMIIVEFRRRSSGSG